MSIWPRRRPALPAFARAWLDPDERMLAFARTSYDELVVATTGGLWITEHGEPRRLAWEHIVTARWNGNALTVTAAAEVAPQIMRRRPALVLPLPEPGDVPRAVRQRVDRSVAASHRRSLPGGSTVLLVARRVSGRDGLAWYAVFDRDADAADEGHRRQARAALEAATHAEPG